MSYNPQLPDVPFASGVPSVLRQLQAPSGSIANSLSNIAIGAAQQQITGFISNAQQTPTGLVNGAFGQAPALLTSNSPSVTNKAAAANQFGMFNHVTKQQIVTPDSFLSLDYKHEWKIADYPMEAGAFQSYNKVQIPFDLRVIMTKGGSNSDRANFLTTLETAAASLDLYDVMTPVYGYIGVNIANMNYRRTSTNGAGLLVVELMLREIRTFPTQTFTNTASPAGAGVVSVGGVQTAALTTSAQVVTSAQAAADHGAVAGAPVGSAQFQSGAIPPPTSTSPAVSPSVAAPVLATETPAIAATGPQFDEKPRDENGNLITPTGGNPALGSLTTPNGYYAVNPATGELNHYPPNGQYPTVVTAKSVQ